MDNTHAERMSFVYTKGEKVKVLSLKDALELGKFLNEDGWVHTSTIDPIVYLEHLCNNKENAIESLSKLINVYNFHEDIAKKAWDNIDDNYDLYKP